MREAVAVNTTGPPTLPPGTPALRQQESTMVVLDIIGALLVIGLLGAMIDEDTRDNRIRVVRDRLDPFA
jgi:hypothetical protein